MRRVAALLVLAISAALAGCGSGGARQGDAAADAAARRAAETIDPALTSALADQIMVDPGLTQQANSHSARMPPAPLEMQIPAGAAPGDDPLQGASADGAAPATLGELAAGQGDCRATLDYSAAWANRLPSVAPLYPDARVQAAAGDDRPGCGLRVVSFSSGDPPAKLDAFYRAAAARAGFAVRVTPGLVAARGAGRAVRVGVAPRRDGGSDVDLIVSGA